MEILCKLGVHKWLYFVFDKDMIKHYNLEDIRRCSKCKKIQMCQFGVIPPEYHWVTISEIFFEGYKKTFK